MEKSVPKKKKRKKKRKRKRELKRRSDAAVAAFQHGGSGAHTDKKKEADKNVCRDKVDQQNEDE